MFDDLKNNGTYREPSRAEIRQERDKAYNRRMKNTMRFIGENMATCTIVLATTVLIGSVFGDIGFNFFSAYTAMDFILTLAAYITIEYMAAKSGAKCGKTYPEYLDLHDTYLDMREEIYKKGIALMDIFCDWQVDVEYEFYLRRQCKRLKINYNEYVAKYSNMSLEDLATMCMQNSARGRDKKSFKRRKRTITSIPRRVKTSGLAKNILYLQSIRHIDLTQEILLTDGKPGKDRAGGVSISGEEHLEQQTTGFGHIAATIITVLLTVVPTFLAKGWSLALLYSAALKLVGVFMRYYRGYSKGAQAYNTVEVKHLQDKIKYLHLYNEYLDKKIYLDLEDKYGCLPDGIKKEAEADEDKRCDSEGGRVETERDLPGAEVHVGI